MTKCLKTLLLIVITVMITLSFVQCSKDYKDDCDIIDYYVHSGDTLCRLYNEYAPDGVSRNEWYYDIQQLNNMPNSMLYAGTTIKLYVKGE